MRVKCNPRIEDVESFGKSAYQPHDDVAELNLEWQLSQALTVTSLTGYATRRYYTRGDDQSSQASVPFNITAVSPGGVFNDPQIGSSNLVQEQTLQDDRNHQWSQELRLESNFDGPVNFSVGANYINYQDFNKYYVILNTATAYSEIENFFGAGIYIDPLQKPDGTGHNYYLNQDSVQVDLHRRLWRSLLAGDGYAAFDGRRAIYPRPKIGRELPGCSFRSRSWILFDVKRKRDICRTDRPGEHCLDAEIVVHRSEHVLRLILARL